MVDPIELMKSELLDAMQRHANDLRAIVDKVAGDHMLLRAEVSTLRSRVEALEIRHSGHAIDDRDAHGAIAASLTSIKDSCSLLLERTKGNPNAATP